MPVAAVPSKLTIRAYNVGFGDCFLLTFHYPKYERRILIDYGSTAAPARAGADYMLAVAKHIREQCKEPDGAPKLHAVVATHRHRDHISGFATDGKGTGKIIAGLRPDIVVQPWTEDPNARKDAKTATTVFYDGGKPSRAALRSQFLASLDDMHQVAAAIEREAAAPNRGFGLKLRQELAFLGDDNKLANRSAINNLIAMGNKGKAAYVNCGSRSGLERVLPGVSIHVLGPPTLEQTATILKERSKDPAEFWHLQAFAQYRSFWRSQALASNGAPGAAAASASLFPGAATFSPEDMPPNLRWFVARSQKVRGSQLLELVRTLDKAMNNTSVILLFKVGKQALLFPGDAQIENWAFALNQKKYQKLLAGVTLYKVGHHGSLNATPKTLWDLFSHRHGAADKAAVRLQSVVSTKKGKHGNSQKKTEVPRATLMAALERETDCRTTEKLKKSEICHTIEIPLSKRS